MEERKHTKTHRNGGCECGKVGTVCVAETDAVGVAGMGAVGIAMSAVLSGSLGISVVRRMNM